MNAYRLPRTPRSVGGFNWRALTCALLVLLFANIVATQYVAHTLGYQPALGKPILKLPKMAVYAPWSWATWTLGTVFKPNADQAVRMILLKSNAIVFGGIFAAFIAFLLVQHAKIRGMAGQAKDLHGSAEWARRRDIRASGLLDAKHGVYVGAWRDGRHTRYLRHNGQDHVLAFAPTRSGKGVGLVIPTLLGSWFESAVIYDIKGENWERTAGFRASLGPVFRFAPADPASSSRFNPLAEIRLHTERDVADAQNIAKMIIHDGVNAHEPYWHETGESLLTGAILHACYAADREGRIACLADVHWLMTEPGKDFRTSLRAWLTFQHTDSGTHPIVALKAQEMLDKEDRNFDGVASTARTALKLYSDPIVARNTSDSDFRIADLVSFARPVSLYVVVPAGEQQRLRPLTRLVFTTIVNRLTEELRTNRHRLLFLIDEFPSLRRLPVFADALSYMAGYGIKAFLIAQDLRQLVDSYGPNESIVSNCNVRVAYAPNTYETALLLSNMLGRQTVLQEVHSFSGKRFSPMPGHMNTSLAHYERPLLTPDEIQRLKAPIKEGDGPLERIVEPGQMLIFHSGHRPILGTQMLYFQDAEMLRRSEIRPPASLSAINDGALIPQRPITRTANIISRVETAPESADLSDEPTEQHDEISWPV
jgi:type IV secretion system protein VirD4